MPHHTPLITTLVGGLVAAFILGALASRLRISPLVGYLLAGVFVGPFTPGFVADLALAPELAEVGVILLMFGVGLHFSLKDLLSVRSIAVPGAITQIGVATALGFAFSWYMGWSVVTGLVFGLTLSTASTVVLLRAVQDRGLIETERGRIAVGWLIVEDLAMVLALVFLPVLASLVGEAAGSSMTLSEILVMLAITMGKVAAFVVIMLVGGRRVIPWILHQLSQWGSREVFRLAVLAIALGVAYGASELFGVSFALGAFFAGMVLNESPLSQQAAEETLPLRDAFAVLFFVSVGMLFDPVNVMRNPWPVLTTLLIIVIGKSIAAFAIVRMFRHSLGTALTISASLAQIGEFSFILGGLAVSLKLMPQQAQDLILASAILSILLNPMIFSILDRLKPWIERRENAGRPKDEAVLPAGDGLVATQLTQHVVLVGYGRVGGTVGQSLLAKGIPFVAIEDRLDVVEGLRRDGIEAFLGNGVLPDLLQAANVAEARWLLVAIPHSFEAGQIVEQARLANPNLTIVARSHSDAHTEHLRQHGANLIFMGEQELARAMVQPVLGDDTAGPVAGDPLFRIDAAC